MPARVKGSAADDEARAWALVLAHEPGEDWPDGPWAREAWTAPARNVLEIFGPLRARRRWVVGQLGQSLDGRIATVSGDSHYINGPDDLRRLHRLRALADAVVVGAGTVASDDPRLTVRHVQGAPPARVVLDPRGRLQRDRRVFTDGEAPTIRIVAGSATSLPGVAGSATSLPGVETVTLPLGDGGEFAPPDILALLRARDLVRVLVEGGGLTVSRFLAAGALDRLHISVAPLVLGSGRPGLQLPVIRSLDEALRPPARHYRLGGDVLFDLDLSADG